MNLLNCTLIWVYKFLVHIKSIQELYLKSSRNTRKHKFTRNKNSHWFKDLQKPVVARQIRQWAEFHKRAPCRLFLPPKCVSQTVGCPLLCPLPGAHKRSVSAECCFCDSSLVEITRQMLSLWHQRSNFKWREIKQNLENKRKIYTTILTLSTVIFVCSFSWYFHNKNTVRWYKSTCITMICV